MRTLSKVTLVMVGLLAVWVPPAHAVAPILKEMEDAFVQLSESVRPAVVSIEVKGKSDTGDNQDMEQYEELFRFFGVPHPQERMRRPPSVAVGSGFIYSKDGLIITNNHVVEGAEKIEVTLFDNQKYDATVVGHDPDTDIAVIKIDAHRDLTIAVLGDSDAVHVGMFAVAMGSPRGFQQSISFGHISALGRNEVNLGPTMRFKNFIQTDAAINLGNSGGPLVNIEGQVIGINTAIVWGAESLGFAIPINKAKEILPELIEKGKVVRGYLGVKIMPVDDYKEVLQLPDNDGAYVYEVLEDTPAGRAGVQYDDVVRKVNGEVVKNPDDLVTKISNIAPGGTATLEIWRKGAPVNVAVKVEEFKSSDIKEAMRGKATLGLRVQTLTPEIVEQLGLQVGAKGVVVADVEPDSPAFEATLQRGDVIVEVAQEAVTSESQFRDLVNKHAQPGGKMLIRVLRNGEKAMPVVLEIPKDYSAK